MGDVKCEWEIAAALGEGPLWVARENAVYWVDIVQRQVHRYTITDGTRQSWAFAQQVTSLAERESGGFVCTIKDGFAFIDFDTGTINPITLPEADIPDNRFNDGKVDSAGRYWAGTMDNSETVKGGALYRLNRDLSLIKADDDYFICNGPTFSVDGKTLYHTDSPQRTIYAFDMDANGDISNKRVFIQLNDDEGYPDGMTTDSENCIWLAHFAGSRITRFSPNGEVLQVIPMPVPNITSCTFGGANLDTLYVTTARHNMRESSIEKYPLSGSFFSIKPGVIGLPTPKFAG